MVSQWYWNNKLCVQACLFKTLCARLSQNIPERHYSLKSMTSENMLQWFMIWVTNTKVVNSPRKSYGCNTPSWLNPRVKYLTTVCSIITFPAISALEVIPAEASAKDWEPERSRGRWEISLTHTHTSLDRLLQGNLLNKQQLRFNDAKQIHLRRKSIIKQGHKSELLLQLAEYKENTITSSLKGKV